MKKINSVVLSALTAAFLVGCGGGSSSNGTPTNEEVIETPTEIMASTDVTVERGPVYGSTVTDSNGQVATQKDGTNVYTFATTPVYPISANGGNIDVNGNRIIDEGDIELTTTLTSYSAVITPITTYLGNTSSDEGKTKLRKLKEILNDSTLSDDDLIKKVPSDLSVDVLVLTNTLYDIMNDGDTSNDDFISDYENSEFKTSFTELKTLVSGYEDKKTIAKMLEKKVITNLGLSTYTASDIIDLPTPSTLIKVAELTRFVSFEKDDNQWYDDNNISEDKLSFKAYDYEYNSEINAYDWILEDENDYVSITKDATNLYKLSYTDPITKEEGTWTLISTKKLKTYDDLYETKAQRIVTKKGTALDWDTWNWPNPTYWENSAEVQITNIDGLEKFFLLQNSVINLDASPQVVIKSDGKVYLEEDESNSVGTWTKENDQIVVTVGTETKYLKVILENEKYYIAEASNENLGYTEYETIYTGSNLEDFISDIKAPTPIFTSSQYAIANENQTGLFFAKTGTEAFKLTVEDGGFVTFSLDGTDAEYFNIDSSGVVTFKTAPDYETKASYNFNVIATNKIGRESSLYIPVIINDIDETESSSSSSSTSTSPFTLTNEMISGKNITFKDGKDTIVTNFYSNNAYFEEFTDVASGNNDGECSGSWSINGDNLIINSKCTDSNILETTTVNFTSSPAVNNTVLVTDNTVSMNVTIESISDISYDASFVLTDVMLSGKKVNISDSFGDASFEFKVGGAYTESWVDLDGDAGSCSGNWKVSAENKVTIENGVCDDNDPAGYFIFNEEPKNGSRFQFNDEDDNGTPYIGTAFIDTISNIE